EKAMARVMANIRGSVLRWARESAGYTAADAATRLSVDEDEYRAWEDDGSVSVPSVPQLRKIAALYGRPLAVFFLASPPTTFQVLRDLRRLPGGTARFLSPNIQMEINTARQRREVAIEMAEELGLSLDPFVFRAELSDDPE